MSSHSLTSNVYPFVLGVESALMLGLLKGYKSIGMVTNDAAKTTSGLPSRSFLLQAGIPLVKLFAPEHGITIRGEDGVSQDDARDETTGLPVISLYRDHPAPTDFSLQDLDLLIFDVPDVGARFYTYLWTLSHVMQSCEKAGLALMVMDRPNPISALTEYSEGPFLDEQHCSSFLGRWSIPLKHGCTLGEMAYFFQQTRTPQLQLIIGRMQGYQRWFRAGLHYPFEPTSPALYRWQAVVLYPGTCLLEGVNVNEGRGTDTPFECFGAPWLDTSLFLSTFPLSTFPYLTLKEVNYTPRNSLYHGELCNGIRIIIDHAEVKDAVKLGLALMDTLFKSHGAHLSERAYPTLVNPSGKDHLDRLLGIQHAFEKWQQGIDVKYHIAEDWQNIIRPYLLYASQQ